LELGLGRVIGAVAFAYVIGLLMAVIFRQEEETRNAITMQLPDPAPSRRSLGQTALYFVAMIGFLVFSDWSDPSQTVIEKTDGTRLQVAVLQKTAADYLVQVEEPTAEHKVGAKLTLLKDDIASIGKVTPPNYAWAARVHELRWYFAGACALALALMLWQWFGREELGEWMENTWGFAKQIVPLLFVGVFITGFVGALLPAEYVAQLVGDNSLMANFVAAVIGAMWYFATLTEIPILQALMGMGMHKGPALALLLAGPALSVPSIAVIYTVIGFKKTAVFCGLVVLMSTVVGMVFGMLVG